jgi:putative Mg2+ transporter-C (MgtC) family protein
MSDNESITAFLVVLVRLGTAAVLGGIIGINREMHGKPAGLRTLALVGLSGALATLLGIEVTSTGKAPDTGAVTRVIQGIMTGIGFLGAGVIFRGEEGKKVTGLTTAATIWVVACLGMACGAGKWRMVIAATLITLVILVIGGPFEKRADELLRRGHHKHEPVEEP